MTHTLAIARRDLSERLPVFATAAVLSVMPFVITLVRGLRGINRVDIITAIGTVGAVGFSLALALILGVSMISRDLTEKRMSFYLSKPLSATSIWFGKVIAALLTVAICFVVMFVPSYVAGTTSWQRSWNVDLSVGFALVSMAALLLLFLGHVFGTMVRSKSPLVALDLVLLVTTVLAVIGIIRPLMEGFASELTKRVAWTLFAALMLILLACGAWQLEKGRADRRQNHIALSRFLWTAMAIVLAIGGAFTAWVVHVSPSELTSFGVSQADQGPWSFVFGQARHRMDYHALFAYDVATGDSVRINGIPSWYSSGMSRDGRTMAFVQLPDYRASQGELYVMPLRRDAKPEPTHITVGAGAEFTFSDDGSRIAVIDSEYNVTVYETASKKALGSARIPNAAHSLRRLFFVTPDVVRIYVQSSQYPTIKVSDHRISIYQFDLRTRSLAQTGQFGISTRKLGFVVSADGTRALIVSDDDSGSSEARVVDASTAQLIEKVQAAGLGHTTLLADGSVATLTKDGAGQWTLNAGGRAVVVGNAPRLYFTRELSGGRIVLNGGAKEHPVLFVVDYAHGSVVRTEHDLDAQTFSYRQWSTADPRRAVADPEQPLAVYGGATKLYSWQPLTGVKKEMLTL